jgi:pimeloyl-ACP methyl ester carboxylesterase
MIFALPGMGADKRVFPDAWQELAGVKFVEWTPFLSATSIPELAAAIAERDGIEDGDSLIGTSLGGMVACEIAKIRRIERLVLVASAVRPDEISGLLSILRPLAAYAPVKLVKAFSASVPGDLARMIGDADVGFVRAMCAAILDWGGVDAVHPGLVRIHGARDLVILPPRKADLRVEGGHLIAMTHAEECVAFLEQTTPGVFRRLGAQG